MTTGKKISAVKLLEDRRISIKPNLRRNMRMVQQLICQPEAKFKKIWEKHSKYPIAFEDGRLFFDNYRTSYSLNGIGFKPTMMYKLGALPSKQKIEDATLTRFSLETIPLIHKGWRPCLLAISLDNYLTRYDLDTGETLQRVFLSNCYKYRHLAWNNLGYSIVVKSIQMKSPVTHSQLSRAGQETPNVLLTFALFDVYPLEFIGVAEITRRIFGKDILDAMITEGMLLVNHQNNLVKLYSWEKLIKQSLKFSAPLGTQCKQLEEGIVGSRSAGLPLNIVISECPPVLFEVKCQHHSLVFGGFPYYYIISPPGKQGQFHVYSVKNNSLSINGKLNMDGLSVEPDKCMFHADESGRVIHVGANEVRVLRIRGSEEANRCSLDEEFDINVKKLHPDSEFSFRNEIGMTSSGRRVKKSSSYVGDSVQCDLESVQLVDYEDDLDLLMVTAVHQEEDILKGTIYLHNNETGEILKKVTLNEPWLEFYRHDVTLDMDKIVHTVEGPGRKFDCYVYQLELRGEEEYETRKSKKKTQQKRKRYGELLVTARQSRRRRRRQQNFGFYNEDSND